MWPQLLKFLYFLTTECSLSLAQRYEVSDRYSYWEFFFSVLYERNLLIKWLNSHSLIYLIMPPWNKAKITKLQFHCSPNIFWNCVEWTLWLWFMESHNTLNFSFPWPAAEKLVNIPESALLYKHTFFFYNLQDGFWGEKKCNKHSMKMTPNQGATASLVLLDQTQAGMFD